MTDTIKAELVYYRIDVSRPEGRKAYAELCETLKEIPFETWRIQGRFPNGTTNFNLRKLNFGLQLTSVKLPIINDAVASLFFIYSTCL